MGPALTQAWIQVPTLPPTRGAQEGYAVTQPLFQSPQEHPL